jgi:hypothetical protein
MTVTLSPKIEPQPHLDVARAVYPVVTVPENVANAAEQLGTKRKFWFQGTDSVKYLFKEARPGTGEDWAEKVASELCELLSLPHATYDLAEWKGRRGVATPNFVPEGAKLVMGNELLARIVAKYPTGKFFHVREHTLNRVLEVLQSEQAQPPPGWRVLSGAESAADAFVGYLMLDAWIANQDRHHENWGLLANNGEGSCLAPSYDHASSLGRNETNETRRDRLTTQDRRRSIEHYVTKARSAFYSTPTAAKPLSPLETFREVAKMRPRAATAWLDQLGDIDLSVIDEIFAKIPESRMTSIAVDFARRMLELNQQRLLSLKGIL